MLEAIGANTDQYPDAEEPYASGLARACRTALEERYSGPDGAVFWLRDYHGREGNHIFCDAFFTGFDAALHFLAKEAEKWPDLYLDPQMNYRITKLISGSGAQLEERCDWYLNNARELWYFDLCPSCTGYSGKDWFPVLDYRGDSPNLPVPFRPGDIVTADCLPYAAPRRVLILEVGDNRDCCCVQALSVRPNGRLDIGAFKHNRFLHGDISHLSGLYRARSYAGPLTEEEKPFAVLSPLLKERGELGKRLWDRIYALELKEQDGSVTWEDLERELDVIMEDKG